MIPCNFTPETFVAGADLRTSQFLAVELSTSATDTVSACNNAGDVPVGILQNKPNSGEAALVAGRPGDIVPALSDGSGTSISRGDWVGTDGGGKMVKKSTDKDFAFGRALDPSTADGTIIRVLVQPTYLGV